MTNLWNQQDITVTGQEWDRSWRCEEFTDLDTDFKIVLHMERVVADSNNNLLSTTPLPSITRSLSQVIHDPDVQAYLILKQTLVKKWFDEDNALRLL